jgi:hypothetical protein
MNNLRQWDAGWQKKNPVKLFYVMQKPRNMKPSEHYAGGLRALDNQDGYLVA